MSTKGPLGAALAGGGGASVPPGEESAAPSATDAAPPATDAASFVRRVTARSGSSFYYAFLLLPRAKREAIYAIYALARAIDDAVDEAPGPEAARARLALWRAEAALLRAGTPRHPIVQAVARARERFAIPLASIDALLEGAAMDLAQSRYRTFDELRVYCERVASSVGLMCIEIFGYRSASAKLYATNLGIALQLTNILRDLGADARRGRLYLPAEDLARFGAREEDVLAGRRTEEVLALLGFESERARGFYAAAAAALDPADRKSLLSAEVMRAIYEHLLGAIVASRFDVFGGRIAVARARRASLALGVLVRTRLARAAAPGRRGNGRGGSS